jgi:Lysylphosphatidylglycerol synthase TM region
VDSVHAFWHATLVFSERLTAVHLGALGLAIGLSIGNLVLRSLAWRNILQAAYPQGKVRRRSIIAAYFAGVGTNAVVPARGGDVMKVYLAHRSMPGAAYTTITSSLVAETLIDVVIGPAILIAAYADGRIPHLPALGHLATWEWTFVLDNGRVFALLLAVLLIGLGIFFTYLERGVSSFWGRI